MTRETGKPLRMSRNERNGLLGRSDFFLNEVDAQRVTQTVLVQVNADRASLGRAA